MTISKQIRSTFVTIKLFFLTLVTYFLNLVKNTFKSEPDMRYKLILDNKSNIIKDSLSTVIYVFKLPSEYDIYINYKNSNIPLNFFEDEKEPGYRFFYGFPIYADEDVSIIYDSCIYGIEEFLFGKGQFIDYNRIFKDLNI